MLNTSGTKKAGSKRLEPAHLLLTTSVERIDYLPLRIVVMQRASHDQGMLLHQRLEKSSLCLSDLPHAQFLADHGVDARDDNLLQIGGRDLLIIGDLDQALAAVQLLHQLRGSEVQLGRDLVDDLIAVIAGKCTQGMLFLRLSAVRFSRGGRCSSRRGDAMR